MTGETVGTAQHLDGLPTAKRSLGWLKWSLVPLGVLAFVLALIGYRRALPDAATTDAPFYVLNLLALNYSSPPDAPPAELDIARFLVHVVAAGAAVVAAFTLLQNRRDRWTVGRMRGHVVVAGNSQLVPDLAINYRRVSKSAPSEGVRARPAGYRHDEPPASSRHQGGRRELLSDSEKEYDLDTARLLPSHLAAVGLMAVRGSTSGSGVPSTSC